MKTARITSAATSASGAHPLVRGGGGGGVNGNSIETTQMRTMSWKSAESLVDEYASRILEERSPPEATVDSSLGPYVTSVLRSWDASPFTDVSELEEFDSLVELVEEHCSMDRHEAVRTLKTIAEAVRTGFVSDSNNGLGAYGRNLLDFSFSSSGILPTFHTDETDGDGSNEDFPPMASGEIPSPMKPDSLIPLDLLGVLDDPPVNSSTVVVTRDHAENSEDEFPPLAGDTSTSSTNSGKKGKAKSFNASREVAVELASVLFRPSRSTYPNDAEEVKSPKLQPTSGVPPQMEESAYAQQQWDSAVEMLLSMNHDLSEEAAVEAALVSNTDVNVAQYIIDGAMSAPAVCRHMLNDGCYRSDCQFSHDIDGHTCLFWLRGRCGKGSSCRFLHGFADKLWEGIHTDVVGHDESTTYNVDADVRRLPASSGLKSEPLPITAATSSTTFSSSPVPSSAQRSSTMSRHNTLPGPASGSMLQPTAFSLPSSWEASSSFSTLNPTAAARAFDKKETTFSFANIATRGYDQTSFSSPSPPGLGGFAQAVSAGSSSANSMNNLPTVRALSPGTAPIAPTATSLPASFKTVKIPQDLWNPHINRDASAFHIVDPMERYYHVSQAVQRTDVIDLHFQSTKTFAVVMEKMLPEKLDKHTQIWVVTGSGHHVGTKTHQQRGGALENAVMSWLNQEGYEFVRGRDRNGHGGALLVKR